jgi:DNA-binding Lrp family transcriptional regulator
VKAYILIQTGAGRVAELVREMSRIRGVRSVYPVTGPYDVIAQAEAPSLTALGEGTLTDIRSLFGVTKALTCPVSDGAT